MIQKLSIVSQETLVALIYLFLFLLPPTKPVSPAIMNRLRCTVRVIVCDCCFGVLHSELSYPRRQMHKSTISSKSSYIFLLEIMNTTGSSQPLQALTATGDIRRFPLKLHFNFCHFLPQFLHVSPFAPLQLKNR